MAIQQIEQAYRSGITHPVELAVALSLAWHADEEGRNCFPRLETVAAESRFSADAVGNAVRRLERDGHITRHKRFGQSTCYELHFQQPLSGAQPELAQDPKRSSALNGRDPAAFEAQDHIISGREPERKGQLNVKEKSQRERATFPSSKSIDLRSEKSGWKAVLEIPPDFPEDLRTALTRWWDYKRERKQSYKQTGWKGLMAECRKRSPKEVIAAIERAISNNWSGIHYEKVAQVSRPAGPPPPSKQTESGPPGWRVAAQRLGVPHLEDYQVWSHVPPPRQDQIRQALSTGDLFSPQP